MTIIHGVATRYLTLWPMTRREQRGLGRGGVRGVLLTAPDAEWLKRIQRARPACAP